MTQIQIDTNWETHDIDPAEWGDMETRHRVSDEPSIFRPRHLNIRREVGTRRPVLISIGGNRVFNGHEDITVSGKLEYDVTRDILPKWLLTHLARMSL